MIGVFAVAAEPVASLHIMSIGYWNGFNDSGQWGIKPFMFVFSPRVFPVAEII